MASVKQCQKIRALVLKSKDTLQDSNTVDDDFEGLTDVIKPILEPHMLAELPTVSTALAPSIAAMVSNIDRTGHRVMPRYFEGHVPKDLDYHVRSEYADIYNFFESCVIDDDDVSSMLKLRQKTGIDREISGNAYWEIIRNHSTHCIKYVKHIPFPTMRTTGYGVDLVEVIEKYVRKEATYDENTGLSEQVHNDPEQSPLSANLDVDYRYEIGERKRHRKFRKYVQSRGGKRVWFKQFGDPRIMDKNTGDYQKEGESIPLFNRATEIYHFKLYSPNSPYGLPRYVGNILGITGERMAEDVCYYTLRNNQVPALALLVANGQLTEGSINRIQEFLENQMSDNRNYSSVLLLEMEPDSMDDGSAKGSIKLEPLSKVQHTDGLWKVYRDGQRETLREAFRVPSIYWGRVEGVGRSANEAKKLADEQVFAPERKDFDEVMNKQILQNAIIGGIKYHTFVSNSPDITDNESLIKMLAVAERTGGSTPEIARQALGEVMNRELGPVVGIQGHVPFSLQLASSLRQQTNSPETNLNLPGEEADVRAGIMSETDTVSEYLENQEEPSEMSDAMVYEDALKTLLDYRQRINNEISKRN